MNAVLNLPHTEILSLNQTGFMYLVLEHKDDGSLTVPFWGLYFYKAAFFIWTKLGLLDFAGLYVRNNSKPIEW